MDLCDKYLNLLRKQLKIKTYEGEEPPKQQSVGIIGAGISGLYSALLLQHYLPNVKVKIYEASERVGGRIFTYKFSEEPYQFSEAGAMRIPCLPCQGHVFRLIDYINQFITAPLDLVDFIQSSPSGNRILVNGTKMKDGRVMNLEYAKSHTSELGFSPRADISNDTRIEELARESLEPVLSDLSNDFEEALHKYKHVSLHQYLMETAGWTEERINYYEMMCWTTNISHASLIDLLLNFLLRFQSKTAWKAIEGGMSKLPEACAQVVTDNGGAILLNSKVESIAYDSETDTTTLGYWTTSETSSELVYETFDAVIMAAPVPCIRTLKKRPAWPDAMEQALRSLRHCPIMKILLRFESRFWERSDLQHKPSLGGSSVTDKPSHWFIYPSEGIGDGGKGVLMVYIRTDDAMLWLSLCKIEKIQLCLRDLQALYPELDISREYAGGTDSTSEKFLGEAFVADWTSQWCMGSACEYYPGQFSYMYPILAQNRGSIYFTGDHLSANPVFMAGALESARFAVQQFVKRQVDKDIQIEHLQ